MSEIWKSIEGYNGLYEVSNFGRVKSYCLDAVGLMKKDYKPKMMKDSSNGLGYRYVVLSKNNNSKNLYIHRLVLKAFVPNPQNKPQVNHKNGIKDDNKLENLEWCTRSENAKHACKMGLWSDHKGENNNYSKLNNNQVVMIKKILKLKKYYQREIGKMFGVHQMTISRIQRGLIWHHVNI